MTLAAGVVLADFNKYFLDSSYQSQQDVNISVESVTSAALVAARALHKIASDGKGAPELKVIIVASLYMPLTVVRLLKLAVTASFQKKPHNLDC